MRRYGNLWATVTSMETLEHAASKASSARKNKAEVAEFMADKDALLRKLQNGMIYHTLGRIEYRQFEKIENGKLRLVSDKPLYPDRIADWAVALVVEPLVDKRLVPQTHASRKGHGIHSAIDDLKEYMDKDARIQYAFTFDLKKCFPTFPKELAKESVRRVIKDPDVLWYIDKTIDEYDLDGLALGNRLSPMIANLVLSYAVDHPMKEDHHCHYYVRYMDDIIVLGYSKQWLHKIRKIMAAQLEEFGLTMKDNWQVFPIDDRGIDFVGYRIYRDKILLRKSTKIRMKRACAAIQAEVDAGGVVDRHGQGTVWSYHGILKWCDSRELARITVNPLIRQIDEQKRLAAGMAAYCDFTRLQEGVMIQ